MKWSKLEPSRKRRRNMNLSKKEEIHKLLHILSSNKRRTCCTGKEARDLTSSVRMPRSRRVVLMSSKWSTCTAVIWTRTTTAPRTSVVTVLVRLIRARDLLMEKLIRVLSMSSFAILIRGSRKLKLLKGQLLSNVSWLPVRMLKSLMKRRPGKNKILTRSNMMCSARTPKRERRLRRD